MAQFTVYQNLNTLSKKIYPYLIDIQSPLLNTLETRLVIPLSLKSHFENKIINNLNPEIQIKNANYILLTQQMAAISIKSIGSIVCDCSSIRQEIISAIDFLITGF